MDTGNNVTKYTMLYRPPTSQKEICSPIPVKSSASTPNRQTIFTQLKIKAASKVRGCLIHSDSASSRRRRIFEPRFQVFCHQLPAGIDTEPRRY